MLECHEPSGTDRSAVLLFQTFLNATHDYDHVCGRCDGYCTGPARLAMMVRLMPTYIEFRSPVPIPQAFGEERCSLPPSSSHRQRNRDIAPRSLCTAYYLPSTGFWGYRRTENYSHLGTGPCMSSCARPTAPHKIMLLPAGFFDSFPNRSSRLP